MVKLALGLLLCGVAGAQVYPVCFEDRVGLDRSARAVFETALRNLAPAGTEIKLGVCDGQAISLSLNTYPPERYSKALGLAYRSGNQVLPELRIYLRPVLKILGNQPSSVLVGRALARVAAHEINHYVRQQTGHVCQGLMRESFSGLQLAAQDLSPFVE